MHATSPWDEHGDLSLVVPIDITEIIQEIRFLEECPHNDPCRPYDIDVSLKSLGYTKEEIEVVVQRLGCTAGVDNDVVWFNRS